jgi:hypothetical protein
MTVTPDRMTFVLELMGLLTIALAVIAICGTVVAVIVFRKADHSAARIFGQLMNRAGMLQMLTVATIVQTVLVLRIFDGLCRRDDFGPQRDRRLRTGRLDEAARGRARARAPCCLALAVIVSTAPCKAVPISCAARPRCRSPLFGLFPLP